jgi:hypothetical protein
MYDQLLAGRHARAGLRDIGHPMRAMLLAGRHVRASACL